MTREEQIYARQFAIMQRQVATLTAALAHSEAVAEQIASELQALEQQLSEFKTKGKQE